MAPKGVESLLALAFSTQRTIGTKNNSVGREASHSSHGGRELPVGTEAYPGGAGKIGVHGLRQDRREVVGSKNSNLLNDPDFMTEMLAN